MQNAKFSKGLKGKEACNPLKTFCIIKIKNGPEIMHFVAHQMQKYLTQGGVQTPKIIYLWI